MMKRLIVLGALSFMMTWGNTASAHCQMPCGIYHDDMVFDQIDQYVETMYKACSILTDNKFNNLHDRLEFVRWVIAKEDQSDTTSDIFLKYFLQQKVKPGEEDTIDKLKTIHKLLFLIVQIKQNCDQKIVLQFGEEWENLKDLYHPQGYECQVELQKCIKRDKDERETWKAGDPLPKVTTGMTGSTGATGTAPAGVSHTHGPGEEPHIH